jgi:hypothetical protein
VSPPPPGAWVAQQARKLLGALDEETTTVRFLLRDRDSKFTRAFDDLWRAVGAEVIRTPIQAPNANAIAERWVGTGSGTQEHRQLECHSPVSSCGAVVEAARAGGHAIPELWPLGTEALALAMEVSVLDAKRLGHRAVLRLSWLLLVASVALSTLLKVAVAPPTLVGYLTAGATRCGCSAPSRC